MIYKGEYFETLNTNSDDNLVLKECYDHIYNQIGMCQEFMKKYPMSFEFLTACGITILEQAEKNPEILRYIWSMPDWKMRGRRPKSF